MSLLTREKLLAKELLKIEKVDLGNEEFVYVRQMTGRERDQFEQSMLKEVKGPNGIDYQRSMKDFRAKVVVYTACDETGKLLLESRDIEVLSTSMSAAKISKIVDIAQRINAITDQDRESLLKNSEAAPSGNSISDFVES